MTNSLIDWVIEKLKQDERLKNIERTPENFLNVQNKNGGSVLTAILGVKNVIEQHDVEPVFNGNSKPQLVVNIPSKTLWSGNAIRYVHGASAAFGSLGDILRASYSEDPSSHRDNNIGFFITAMEQHTNVKNVSYIYDNVFNVDRKRGDSLTVAIIEAYNMSAEDVRNARTKLGFFDIVVKSTSYGSVTCEAMVAAKSMGAEAMKFGDLMARLNR